VKSLLDAAAIQDEYGTTRRQAYAVLHAVGVRITPRRLVVLRSRLEEYLGGGDRVDDTAPGMASGPRSDAAARA
jgi:hypothetical protein